ncbi:MAG TPA: YjjG family noncanonical pyrimidine nucleotidase [Hanamia sp.]|nr:YjjG family noncanonical pyrimidine nucleotidase [Hanamia sp.]
MKYQHLFFDLDHTLWDFDANAKDALTELYQFFNLESRVFNNFNDFYLVYLNHNATLWSRFEKGYITVDELKWRRMWRTLLDFQIADEKLARDMSDYYLEILPTKKRVFEYTYEILDYLTKKKYSLHLLTNGFEKTQRIKLESAHLTGYFKNVVTSETSNSVKPKKEIFEYALQKAKGKMEESIMIGDNLNADILGAKNAGMDSIFVNYINAEGSDDPTYTIHHLKELESIL